jgi:hypothetical protein
LVKQANELIAGRESRISGKDLLELFEQHQITIHPNTLTKWFRPLNGFAKLEFIYCRNCTGNSGSTHLQTPEGDKQYYPVLVKAS